MRLLRNLAFYFAFYLGSLLITSASLAVLPFSVEAFRRQVRNWSQWQRWCLTPGEGSQDKVRQRACSEAP